MEILPDRLALARYGLNIRDVMDVVEVGLGGLNVSTTIEGRARYPIQLRLERGERERHRTNRRHPHSHQGRRQCPPLARSPKSNALPAPAKSPARTASSASSSRPTCRTATSAASSTKSATASKKEVTLPPGVTLKWSGQYEQQLNAQRTLLLIVPVVLLIIFMLLTVVFRSISEAAHVILAVPFALTGGVLLQYMLGYNFSVAVWIGYIALFGTAIQTGVVMVVYLEEALKRKQQERGRPSVSPTSKPPCWKAPCSASVPKS